MERIKTFEFSKLQIFVNKHFTREHFHTLKIRTKKGVKTSKPIMKIRLRNKSFIRNDWQKHWKISMSLFTIIYDFEDAIICAFLRWTKKKRSARKISLFKIVIFVNKAQKILQSSSKSELSLRNQIFSKRWFEPSVKFLTSLLVTLFALLT